MFSSKKPYSAITVHVDSLTSQKFDEEDLSGIPDLIEVIKLQATGPTEAARALRKKLKYGNTHNQIRALVLLNGLIENGGPKVQRNVFDEPLLERLRVCGSSELYDPKVRAKCGLYFASWRHNYKNTPGMGDLANLYKMLPRRKKEVTRDTSKVLKETERDPFEDDEETAASPPTPQKSAASGSQSSPSAQPDSHKHKSKGSISSSFFGSSQTMSSKEKALAKRSKRIFDEAAEKESMKRKIADAHVESAALMDILRRINRQEERISENEEAKAQFAKVKRLRQYVRRYIQYVSSDELLGPLLAAHDTLMNALVTFEQLDRSIDADSDSDDELAEQQHAYRMMEERRRQHEAGSAMADMAGLSMEPTSPPVAPPRPRPSKAVAPPKPKIEPKPEPKIEIEDEDDPFGDSNAVDTPILEQEEPKWRSV